LGRKPFVRHIPYMGYRVLKLYYIGGGGGGRNVAP
jgi:hypothetical protein